MSASRVLLHSARLQQFQAGENVATDIKGWIANQNYFIDADITSDSFTLRASNALELSSALGNDLNRMAIAAFESISGVRAEQHLPRSLAWSSIRSYYAAFFAAHAIMRIFGTSCSQLEFEHVKKIYESATIFGRTGGIRSIDAGFYAIEIDPTFSLIKFNCLRDSHKDTWKTFLNVINAISNDIPGSTAISKHKVEASALLDEIKTRLTSAGCSGGNWLSHMRNSINYRHSHGVWFPYSLRSTRTNLHETVSRDWLRAPTTRAGEHLAELDTFFEASVLLVSVMRELITSAVNLADPVNPMIRNGCIRLLNELRAS